VASRTCTIPFWRTITGAIVIVGALALSACSSSSKAGDATSVSSTTTAPTAAAVTRPDRAGPYKVGHETITVTSKDGKRLRTVDVWYPADPGTTGKATRYSEAALPSLYVVSALALEEVPVAEDAPFPLVVYSHGSGALRFIGTFFTERLASHGFVVVSADHTGDTALDLLAGHLPSFNDEANVIASRVADVRLTVDSVLARSQRSADLLSGAVDPQRIGMSGHSFGGLTAFAAAGGVTAVPGTVAIPRDPRFKALVAMDATPGLLIPTDLARVRVPTLAIVAENYPEFWYGTNADPFLEVQLPTAAHDELSDVCEWAELGDKFPDAPKIVVNYLALIASQSCRPPNMAPRRVHELTDWYAIAFLARYLAGDTRYEKFLDGYPPGPHADVIVSHPKVGSSTTTRRPGAGRAPVP
jgi:dienelactone hydrolase